MRVPSIVLAFLFTITAHAQQVTTPKPGSAERKALMDAMRLALKKPMRGKQMLFKVDHLRVSGSWAFFFGRPVKPNGSAFDYRGTDYAQYVNSGAFDDNCGALFKKTAGKWKAVTWFVGATDVPWVEWPQLYGCPKGLLPF